MRPQSPTNRPGLDREILRGTVTFGPAAFLACRSPGVTVICRAVSYGRQALVLEACDLFEQLTPEQVQRLDGPCQDAARSNARRPFTRRASQA